MASGFADPDLFNQSLWHADQLAYTQHTLTLTNVPLPPDNTFLDLDFVSIERQIGQPGCVHKPNSARWMLIFCAFAGTRYTSFHWTTRLLM